MKPNDNEDTALAASPAADTDVPAATAAGAARTHAAGGVTPSEKTHVAEIIVVTSGKGGVGKTTTSASLASGLAKHGKKVAVIDFDVGLRNLDLVMGAERRVVFDLINVTQGVAKLSQALIRDKRVDSLFLLPASQTRDKDALTEEGVEKVLKELEHQGFDYIVCDSPAGIEHGAVIPPALFDAIAQYRREWDEKRGMFKDNPLHDWTSHGADQFRYAAVVEKEMTNEMGRPAVATTGLVKPYYPGMG